MAYLTYLHSVPEARFQAFCKDQNESLRATRSVVCTHLIAYWIEIQPLGELLGQAIDGGEILHSSFWHPLRPPKIHNSISITAIYPKLKAAWKIASIDSPLAEDDYYGKQIQKVVDLFAWAQSRSELIVSYLQPPHDEERANRVAYPKIS